MMAEACEPPRVARSSRKTSEIFEPYSLAHSLTKDMPIDIQIRHFEIVECFFATETWRNLESDALMVCGTRAARRKPFFEERSDQNCPVVFEDQLVVKILDVDWKFICFRKANIEKHDTWLSL